MQVDQRTQLGDLRNFIPDLFCLFFLLETGLLLIGLAGHGSTTDYINRED